MPKNTTKETPAEKKPQSVESKPVSPELKARQEKVNKLTKDLLTKITKNSKGKTPPELSQAVTAAAWAIERGDLKKKDIANIKNAGELKARVDAIKPDVVTKTSPELAAAQKEVNVITKEIASAISVNKMTQEINSLITSAAWLVQKKAVARDYFTKDVTSIEDISKRMDEYKTKKALQHPVRTPSEAEVAIREKVTKMAKEIALALSPEVNGVKKMNPEANCQAIRAAWRIQKEGITREEFMKNIKSVEQLKAKLDGLTPKAQEKTNASIPER